MTNPVQTHFAIGNDYTLIEDYIYDYLITQTKTPTFVLAWITGFICIGVFGELIMIYLKYFIGLTPLRHLAGTAGFIVMVIFIAMCLHFVTHRLTSADRDG